MKAAPLPSILVVRPGAFRLLLALAVVASHVTGQEVGRIAVLLFFFLSGYWVTTLWAWKFREENLLIFYASRYLRIFPLYFFVVAVVALLSGRPLSIPHYTLLGLATANDDLITVSWSLDIELQFYLALPAVLWLLRTGGPWRRFASIVAVTAVGWGLFLQTGIMSAAQYMPAFALGAACCLYGWKPDQRSAHVSLAAFALTTAAIYAIPYTRSFVDHSERDYASLDIFSFFWMLPLLPYVAYSVTLPSSRMDRQLGDISYPLYLVHVPIILWVRATWGAGDLVRILAVGAAIIGALALYALIDRPLETRRRKAFEPRQVATDSKA